MSDPPEVRIYRTTVAVGGAIKMMDAIEHAGHFWLVPQWLEHTERGWITPARIICLTGLRYQDLRNNSATTACDLAVNIPIPQHVLDGKLQGAESAIYRVVERPPLVFRKPSIH